jgi:hypothetical protein
VEEDLVFYMTIGEAADELELSLSSVRRMVSDSTHPDHIPSRIATHDECMQLFLGEPQRIKGVPGTGIRLIHQDAVAKAKIRKKKGRPKTKMLHGNSHQG